MQTQGLGWKRKEDPRNADYPIRLLAEPDRPVTPRDVFYAMFGYPLDQGGTGTCVGHAGKHFELTVPIIRTKRMGPPTGIDFYLKATKYDEWHNGQEDTTLQDGTSITALMTALKNDFGMIDSYHWTQDVDEIVQFMSQPDGGPVVIGIPWYNSMFTTDEDGFVNIDFSSGLAGGHSILWSGLKVNRVANPYATGPNSWGRPADFGKLNKKTGMRDGRWRIHLDEMRRLFSEGGDACAAREVKRRFQDE